MIQIFFVCLLSVHLSSYANNKKSLQIYPLNSEIKNLRFLLSGSNLKIVPLKKSKESPKELRIWLNDSPKLWRKSINYQVEKDTLIISDKYFYTAKNILNTNKTKPLQIILEVPTISIQVMAIGKGGVITIKNLKNDLIQVSAQYNTSIIIQNTQGELKLFQGAGSAQIKSHQGTLIAQGENAHIQLKSCQANMKLHYFKGRISIEDSKGSIHLRTFKAKSSLKKFTGRLNFHIEKANLSLKQISGSITGFSKEGNIYGVLYPNTVKIETESGKIWLDMPKSNIWVQAESWEGKIRTPDYFSHIRTGGMDRASGELRGTKKRKGRVSLKSRSGAITVHQSS